jgi:hypothetical protein
MQNLLHATGRAVARTLRVLALTLAFFVVVSPARAQVMHTIGGTQFELNAATGLDPYIAQSIEIIDGRWPAIADTLEAPEGDTIHVFFEHRFEDWFDRNDVPSRPPEYAIGLAFPSRRIILMVPGNTHWQTTLAHEMTHVAVAMAAADGGVPVWFTEGMAVYLAEQWDFEKASVLARATTGGGVLDMHTIVSEWPDYSDPASLAYAQSYRFVRWSEERWGTELWPDVLAQVRDGVAFSAAFQDETGQLLSITYDEFERAMNRGGLWGPIAVIGLLLLGALAGVVGVAWWRRLKQRKVRLQRLGAREESRYGADPDDITFR